MPVLHFLFLGPWKREHTNKNYLRRYIQIHRFMHNLNSLTIILQLRNALFLHLQIFEEALVGVEVGSLGLSLGFSWKNNGKEREEVGEQKGDR